MNSTPSPAMFATRTTLAKVAVAFVEPDAPTTPTYDPDRVVKAKHLKIGQQVQALVQGTPRGRVNTVLDTERINEGAQVEITWDNDEPGVTRAAAFRYLLIQDAPKTSGSTATLASTVSESLDVTTLNKLANVGSREKQVNA